MDGEDCATSKLSAFFRLMRRIDVYLRKKNNLEVTEEEELEYAKDIERGLVQKLHTIPEKELIEGYRYDPIIKRFAWKQMKQSEWVVRTFKSDTIAFIQTVSPMTKDRDRYYVSLLLHHIRKPKCFDDLKFGHPTFALACAELGLIGTDDEYVNNILAAGQTPETNRRSFDHLLSTNNIRFPSHFINSIFDRLTSDLVVTHYQRYGIPLDENESLLFLSEEEQKRAYLLFIIGTWNLELSFEELNFTPEDIELFCTFEAPPLLEENIGSNSNIGSEFRVTSVTEVEHEMVLSRLNPIQLSHFHTITDAVMNDNPSNTDKNVFFLDAPAGSGKTFVTELMIQSLRLKNKLVLPVASTGIASLLLEKGMTAHKCFKIPIHTEYSCNPSSPLACSPAPEMCEVLANCDFIVWDEVTMSPLSVIDGVDQLMRKVKERDDKPFGGCTVLFSGDFRQCLLIVKGNPTIGEVFQRCTLSSSFINGIQFLTMTENMRILSSNHSPEQLTLLKTQSEFLLDIGSGLHLASGRGLENINILTQNLHAFYPSDGQWYENFIRKYIQPLNYNFVLI
jgi:hypothetical protein